MSIDIDKVATDPKFAQNENGTFRMHDLDDIIAADRYKRSLASAAGGKNPFKMGLTKVTPPAPR